MRLSKISLNHLSKAEMEKKEQNMLRGGIGSCGCVCMGVCGCLYQGEQEGPYDSYYGGSSTHDNSNENGNNMTRSLVDMKAQSTYEY